MHDRCVFVCLFVCFVSVLALVDSFPNLATDVIYVAGDRVVTDPLCKPFSMGRNLFCVHSKKHMDDEPELKAAKMETNRKTLVAMQRAFNKGKQADCDQMSGVWAFCRGPYLLKGGFFWGEGGGIP
jgi:hypothetical protein